MPKVIAVAQVEDAAKWEEGFRTHAELFRSQTINTPIRFAVTDDNQIVVCFEPDDVETYLEIMDSPAIAEAMAFDGVMRETVKLFVLDKEFDVTG